MKKQTNNQGENSSISLEQVNKQKRKLNLPQIKNPFKKQVGPARDEAGKFTAGSGGLITKSKFDFSRMLPVALVVALVGGFFVFRSFAATGNTPAYQYSIQTCFTQGISKVDVSKLTQQQKNCVDLSAEALSYRISIAALGRANDWIYNNYTQKLAGDRIDNAQVASAAANLNEVRWGSLSDKDYVEKVAGLAKPNQKAQWVRDIQQKKMSREQLAKNVAALFKMSERKVLESSYKLNNQQFVEFIFKNVLKRGESYKADSRSSHLKQLNEEKLTRGQVLALITKSEEAKNKNREDVVKYAKSKPPVKIEQTAKKQQTARINRLAVLANDAKIHYEKGVVYHTNQAKSQTSNAQKQAAPNPPNANNVQSAKNIEAAVNNNMKHAKESAANAKKVADEATKLYKAVNDLSKRATDITQGKSKQYYDSIQKHVSQSNAKISSLQQSINQVVSYRKQAEQKFNAEQARLSRIAAEKAAAANAAAAQQGGGAVSGGGSVGANTPRCPKYYQLRSEFGGKSKYCQLEADGLKLVQSDTPAVQTSCGGVNQTNPSGYKYFQVKCPQGDKTYNIILTCRKYYYQEIYSSGRQTKCSRLPSIKSVQ